MKYQTCPKCGITYNVSRERDDSKVFVCQDCEIRERAKMQHKKPSTIYDRIGLAKYLY